MRNPDEMSTEELLLEAQSRNLDNMFRRLERPSLPDWVAAVDENGLSRGYEESYEDFQQRL